jgi:hypothetical protein
MGLRLVCYSPGTLATSDYTTPDHGKRYRTSDEIYKSIIDYEIEAKYGLNGFILLIHVGTHPARTDKFYHKLDQLVTQLQEKNYAFKRIDELI